MSKTLEQALKWNTQKAGKQRVEGALTTEVT